MTSAIGVALLMVGLVLAMDNFQTFHATGEQVNQGIGVSGGYTDTLAADGAYRLIREEYASSQARTLGDNPSNFSYFTTYTDVVNFTPYTMPVEGGLIYQIGIYVFEVGSGDTEFRVALYEDTESVPRLLLAQSEPLTATSTGWLWFDVEPQSIPGNTRYWLAYQATDRDARLGWRNTSPYQGYYFREWDWGPFPALAGRTWGPVYRRTCYQIAYTATHYALDVE
ncbi:MAG TPA: hypothetical protein VM537_27655, partial [Anaerolineae bacterium]|nr:hypothetical protein [Anaerolineae bacterium]